MVILSWICLIAAGTMIFINRPEGVHPYLAAFLVIKAIDCKRLYRKSKDIKPDRYPMCEDQPAQIDCRVTECKKHGKGACNDISPALTLNPDKSYVCWSMEIESAPSN